MSQLAAPVNADLMKSTAVQYVEEVSDGLQLNIFSQDSRHFDIVSEVTGVFKSNSSGVNTKHVHRQHTCKRHMYSFDHNYLGGPVRVTGAEW